MNNPIIIHEWSMQLGILGPLIEWKEFALCALMERRLRLFVPFVRRMVKAKYLNPNNMSKLWVKLYHLSMNATCRMMSIWGVQKVVSKPLFMKEIALGCSQWRPTIK